MSIDIESAKLLWFENNKDKLKVCQHCGNTWLPKKKDVKYCPECTNKLDTTPQRKHKNIIKTI